LIFGKFIKTLDLITDTTLQFDSLISRADAAFRVVLRQIDIRTVKQDGMTKGFELPIGVVTRRTYLVAGSTFDPILCQLNAWIRGERATDK
jgi:hypothetical protein